MILYITDRNIRVDNADNQISYNSDYIAEFRFDEEWNGKVKTARFVQNGEYFDVVLVDDRCEIPPLKTGFIRVGVFTDSMTSTYADVYFKASIKDGSGNPVEPPEDVYAQLTALIESGMLKGADGLTPYVGENNNWWIGDMDTGILARGYTPVKGVDYFTEGEVQQIQSEVSSGAIGDFKTVVDSETNKFDANADSKFEAYNQNDSKKTEAYNSNAQTKMADYNTNADNRVAEFDAHTEQIQTDISGLKSDLPNKLKKANERFYIGNIVEDKWQQSNGDEYRASNGFYLSANVQPNTKYYATGMILNSAFPLIVMFDENNNVIGTKETSGDYTVINDYGFITPSNCVKVSVNGRKVTSAEESNTIYPSLYYVQNKDLDGNDFEYLINSKQNQRAEWKKATYQFEKNKFVQITDMSASYKVKVNSDSVALGYNYAKLIYDKNKKYRFFGQCKTDVIPPVICCDDNDNIIKIYDKEVGKVLKGKEYDDIPQTTYCIYVNGQALGAQIEIKQERSITSFEGGKTGVFFGDSITQGNNVYIANNITPMQDYPSIVKEILDCTAYNGGLGGSTYASGRSIDFKNVCDCVVSGDFSSIIEGISKYGLNQSAILQYNAISELDFNNVDFVSIALGTNDWNFGISAENIKNAMRYCISTLLTAYPHLKIYVFTPIYRFNLNDSGEDSDTYVNTTSGLKLHEVCEAIIDTAKEFNVPCKDMYYGCNINQYNKALYMGDDTHPNANGYALMGEKIAKTRRLGKAMCQPINSSLYYL